MNNKQRMLTITISGATGSGKTALQQHIAKLLSDKFKTMTVDYGVDGIPNRSDDTVNNIIDQIGEHTYIYITTANTPRSNSNN